MAATPEVVELQPIERQIAHCGLEGCPVSASAMLNATAKKAPTKNSVTNSIWGNLLLNITYQQDEQLQSWIKILGRVDLFTLTSMAAISGLGMAQGIDTLATLQDEPHPKHPVVLGLVGTGTSLGSLAIRAGLNHHYGKFIAKRQLALKGQIQSILGQLKDGTPFTNIQPAWVSLVGDKATQEFSKIWQATHINR
jgi:hypothetical protein